MAKATTSKKINLQPTAGYFLIEPEAKEERTASGIYLPEGAGEKPQQGTVLAVGADDVTDSGAVKKAPAKEGDTVIYKKWGGNEVKIKDQEYLFVKFEDILAIVKE